MSDPTKINYETEALARIFRSEQAETDAAAMLLATQAKVYALLHLARVTSSRA